MSSKFILFGFSHKMAMATRRPTTRITRPSSSASTAAWFTPTSRTSPSTPRSTPEAELDAPQPLGEPPECADKLCPVSVHHFSHLRCFDNVRHSSELNIIRISHFWRLQQEKPQSAFYFISNLSHFKRCFFLQILRYSFSPLRQSIIILIVYFYKTAVLSWCFEILAGDFNRRFFKYFIGGQNLIIIGLMLCFRCCAVLLAPRSTWTTTAPTPWPCCRTLSRRPTTNSSSARPEPPAARRQSKR